MLLLHGTGRTAPQHWGTTYLPRMAAQGRPVCTVSLPGLGLRVQVSPATSR